MDGQQVGAGPFDLTSDAIAVQGPDTFVARELKRLEWSPSELGERHKSDPAKLQLALRLRRETTLTIRQIAQRLHMGSWKSLNNKLYLAAKASTNGRKRETA